MSATAQGTGTCAGCGDPIPPSRGGPPRKWCSDRCRKAQYAGTCETCGGPTDGTTPGKGIAKVCVSCLQWSDEALIESLRRWADEHDGLPPTCTDWRRAHPGYPCAQVIVRRLGWNEALLRAGFGLRCDRRPETQEWIEEQLRGGGLCRGGRRRARGHPPEHHEPLPLPGLRHRHGS